VADDARKSWLKCTQPRDRHHHADQLPDCAAGETVVQVPGNLLPALLPGPLGLRADDSLPGGKQRRTHGQASGRCGFDLTEDRAIYQSRYYYLVRIRKGSETQRAENDENHHPH
jgi:hypothetical protein